MENNKGNICGILGICLSWIPFAGFILGIIALARREDTPALGILAIIFSVIIFTINLVLILT